MRFVVYDVLYSQNSHQLVSADILAILSVMLVYKNTKMQMWLTVSTSLHNNKYYKYRRTCVGFFSIFWIILIHERWYILK
jgi:hypothetical protein